MQVTIRPATDADVPQLQDLISASARVLSRGHYTAVQTEAAIAHVFGVDSTLISDGTYFVAQDAGLICGCGGWSKRATLFGGDQYAARDYHLLDPRADTAKIRAFFIHPAHARRGVGRAILQRCESEAKAHGFKSVELMSTLPGVGFYLACGYTASARRLFTVGGEVELEFIEMKKSL